jgi:hypothetical protein
MTDLHPDVRELALATFAANGRLVSAGKGKDKQAGAKPHGSRPPIIPPDQ